MKFDVSSLEIAANFPGMLFLQNQHLVATPGSAKSSVGSAAPRLPSSIHISLLTV